MTAIAAGKKTGFDYNAMAVLAICIAGAVWALLAAAIGADAAMRTHAWLILAGFLAGIAIIAGAYSNGGIDTDKREYNESIVRYGVIASMFWAVVGMLVGVIIAAQLAWPTVFQFEAFPQINFGRLRPVHTSGVIFAFGGNVLIATSFYVVQRTSRVRLAGGV
jgi:cytochrome c oxidase cbb3-type subunit 1